MPTITIDLSDLNNLLGKKYTLSELKNPLQNLGIEVEGMTTESLKLEVFHNRPDLFGVEGIARALKGYLGIETGVPNYDLLKPKIKLKVDSEVKKIRPVIVMGIVENADFSERSLKGLMDLQDTLHEIIGQDRRKISIGTYDMKDLKTPIRFTTIEPESEGFAPLDFRKKLSPKEILEKHPKGKEYSHLMEGLRKYPILVDSNDQVLSMPPIINSEKSRVTINTKKMAIDVTGTDRKAAEQALQVVMSAVAERGFDLRAVTVEYPDKTLETPRIENRKRTFDIKRANTKLGLDLSSDEIKEIIEKMRYRVLEEENGKIKVEVPFYRFDLMHEVDLFEDIAIGFGYDRLEPYLPSIETSGEVKPESEMSEIAREILTGLGLMEVMPYMLTSEKLNFEMMNFEGDAVTIKNPISEEYSILRSWLLPGLMEVLRENRHHELPQQIFEVGDVVTLDKESENGAKTVRRAAAAETGEKAEFTYSRSLAEALLRELDIEWKVKPFEHPSLINERAAEFLVEGKHIGFVGELHPEVILNFELSHPVAVFEVDLPTWVIE